MEENSGMQNINSHALFTEIEDNNCISNNNSFIRIITYSTLLTYIDTSISENSFKIS